MEKSLNQLINKIMEEWMKQKKEISSSSPYLKKQIQILESLLVGLYEMFKFPNMEEFLLSGKEEFSSKQTEDIKDFVCSLEGMSFEAIRQINKINEIISRIGEVKIDKTLIDLIQNLLDETETILPNIEKVLDDYKRVRKNIRLLNVVYRIEKPEEDEDDW